MTATSAESSRPVLNWLSVHALTEFVFCGRAGVVAVENDWHHEPVQELPHLGFYLPHDLADLESQLHQAMNRLWLWVIAAVLAFTMICVAWWRHDLLVGIVATAACLLTSIPLPYWLERVLQLSYQRRDLLAWQARDPDVDVQSRHPVDWRDFVRSDWVSVPCHEAYRDEVLGLVGKPWCVIRRGSQTIPVWRLPRSSSDAKHEIQPQHVIRMAAYCHLIATCEGRACPVGIVLFADSYLGVTLPFDDASRAALSAQLAAARTILSTIATNDRWTPPLPHPALCGGCPCGAPRAYRELQTEFRRDGEVIPVYGFTTADRKLYHSPCGDRFRWKPPHARAKSLGIAAGG